MRRIAGLRVFLPLLLTTPLLVHTSAQQTTQPDRATAAAPAPASPGTDVVVNGSFETPGQSATFAAPADSAPATFTIKVQATDPGGLTGTDTATVKVIWQFTGFFSPVDAAPTFNVVKAGQSVPVKFSLGGDQGLGVLAGTLVTQVACPVSAVLDSVEETLPTATSSLRYDTATGQYIYVWKTDKSWGNSCRKLTLDFADGTSQYALFEFTL